jgi:hypothetical protein
MNNQIAVFENYNIRSEPVTKCNQLKLEAAFRSRKEILREMTILDEDSAKIIKTNGKWV